MREGKPTRLISTRVLLWPKKRVCSDLAPLLTVSPRIVPGGAVPSTPAPPKSAVAGLLATLLSSLSTLATSSSNGMSPFLTGVLYCASPEGVGWHALFCARVPSASASDPSESRRPSWSVAYRQARPDFWHCEQGHERSHLSLRLRHSVHDFTGRGRLTLRGGAAPPWEEFGCGEYARKERGSEGGPGAVAGVS